MKLNTTNLKNRLLKILALVTTTGALLTLTPAALADHTPQSNREAVASLRRLDSLAHRALDEAASTFRGGRRCGTERAAFESVATFEQRVDVIRDSFFANGCLNTMVNNLMCLKSEGAAARCALDRAEAPRCISETIRCALEEARSLRYILVDYQEEIAAREAETRREAAIAAAREEAVRRAAWSHRYDDRDRGYDRDHNHDRRPAYGMRSSR